MGCFSINGYVSHLPIVEGDKCFAMIGIFDKNILSDDICDRSNPFIPIALPIFGEYNDYGYLENVVRDKNVEVIEKFFDKSIESILSDILRGTNLYDKIEYEDSKLAYFSLIIDHSFIYDKINEMANFINLEGAYEVSMKTFEEFTKYYDKDYYVHTDFLKDGGYIDDYRLFINANSCFDLCRGKINDYHDYRPSIHPYFYHMNHSYDDSKYELFLYRRRDMADYLMRNMKDEYLKFVNFNENSKFYGLKYFPNTSSSQCGMDDIPAMIKLTESINKFAKEKLEKYERERE